MFPWNIAKSAEALFSRLAIKRVCKFLLKKKLGQFILGDIDLDQLDVQLAAGSLQLTDLALNVDFLNQKLGQGSMFRVREGSIRSLLMKMPWSGKGCEVEVDELELVLSPSYADGLHEVAKTRDSNKDYCVGHDLGKDENDMAYESSAASVNVHEGVKTIAKMVKRLLTSFHIRIKSVIVAFNACVEQDEEKEGPYDTLVLRVTEIECGACISDDGNSTGGADAEDFLGISHLMNFLKFQGANVELLQMNYNQTFPAASQVPNASKPFLTGERGGFCGSMKLSIPWKNGSLDIREVDAEVNIDPLIAKLQLSTLKWILVTWKMLENYENKKVGNVYHMDADKVTDSTSQCGLSALSSTMPSDKKLPPECGSSTNFSGPLNEEIVTDVLLKESHLISDWVPFSVGKCQNEGIEETDLGASVDQFFECFDGMRSSQSVLGGSGMRRWTCSVFSAITAVSNLASGSFYISAEQQHVRTNLKITLVGISTNFSFVDEDQLTQHGTADGQVDTDSDVHHLGLRCQDIFIAVQVYPQDWKLEATVKHIGLHDHFYQEGASVDFSLHDHEKCLTDQTLMIRCLQDKVQSALPSSSLFAKASNVEVSDASKIMEAPSGLSSVESCACSSNMVTATLFETSGASHCLLAVSSRSSNSQFTGQVSFSLEIPPFVFWLNFDLVNTVLDFSRKLGNFSGKNKCGADFSSEAFEEKYESSSSNMMWSPNHHITSTSWKGGLHGSIFLPRGRIILCFPFKNGRGFRSYTSLDQFIALDFSSPPNFKKLKAERSAFVQEGASWKEYFPSPSHSVHLDAVNLDVYHITRAVGGDSGWSTDLESQRFCSDRILSLRNGTDWVHVFSMLWHENAMTGAWIVKSAKILATSDSPANKMSSATTDYEFASVSTRADKEDSSDQKQKELILSSKFCLHVGLPAMLVTLYSSQYLCLFHLLNQVVDAISTVGNGTACENRETTVNQTSIFLECGRVEIQIELDQGDHPKSSLQRELPGSWYTLRLEIQNLQLLSVSDTGAVSGASFLWISHSEGKLWGSITTMANQDVLLISCSNSSNGRGDGEGSNVLSCGPAGSDFIHLSDPDSFHDFMSITLKCWTIVAPGGRLDWLDKISSFFSLPPPETSQVADCNLQKGDSQRLSFVLKFIDGALSYEPYIGELEVDGECLNSKSCVTVGLEENRSDPYFACLLAASSLTLSNAIAVSCDNDYSIRFQDVGLLLHAVSKQEKFLGEYSVDHLRELGYVKVAGEALVYAVLRVNYENDICWELNCSELHIVLSTCCDTTFGLICLASQIQELFAPDMEESLVHLQNRWHSLQQVQETDDSKGVSETSSNGSSRTSQVQQLHPDSKVEPGLLGLMGEICEDAFLFHGKTVSSFDGSEPGLVDVNDRDLHGEGRSSTSPCRDISVDGGHTSILGKTEIMEGYCLSVLRSLSELTINSHFPKEISQSDLVSRGNVDVQRGNSGWYGRTSLRIVDNYVPDRITDWTSSKQLLEGQQNNKKFNDSQRYKGRLLLKNVEVKWRMYSGSDWHELGKNVQHSGDICGRDGTVCLELALSNMSVQYDIFPNGDIPVSKLCISVQDVHLYDKSRNAPWKEVLGYYNSKERPRESFSKALKLDLEAFRPDPMTPLEEFRLRIYVLPILLHLHQRQLDFLIGFFNGKYSLDDPSQGDPRDSGLSDISSTKDNKKRGLGIADEALLPFFQKFDILPIIVRVDYHPSRVDLAALSGGKYVELVNLVPWKGVELQLKHVQAAGVYGWSNVCETIIGEWLEDISQNQVRKLLQGLPTIQSFVSVGSGAAKLVSLPVKNYMEDHRLVKGLQRGTVAFLRSISVEALGLGVHLAAGAHEILRHAECILTRIQPSLPRPTRSKLKSDPGSNQPEDAQHGLQQAYESLSDGLGKTASALLRTPMKTYQRGGGAGTALVTAVRGAPAAAIAPASAAAQALQCALLGVRNSLNPKRKESSMNKYVGPSRSWEQS